MVYYIGPVYSLQLLLSHFGAWERQAKNANKLIEACINQQSTQKSWLSSVCLAQSFLVQVS